jgi:threonine dehydratase
MEEREAACARVVAETGASIVPPYDFGPTIAGQGTIALEFLEQVRVGSCVLYEKTIVL